ncbi:hypothetical protein BASA81_018016 [Batrachochytrium salamandrivorans]|nr:hypothetical protein BASA81_018016 [Batrachochytrium salamandrivorans]
MTGASFVYLSSKQAFEDQMDYVSNQMAANKPFSFQRKNLMQSIKLRLYEANDDQTAVVMARLDEASQTPLQLFSSSALATKRGLSSRVHTKRKAIPARKIIL